jgi:hypothetical protein
MGLLPRKQKCEKYWTVPSKHRHTACTTQPKPIDINCQPHRNYSTSSTMFSELSGPSLSPRTIQAGAPTPRPDLVFKTISTQLYSDSGFPLQKAQDIPVSPTTSTEQLKPRNLTYPKLIEITKPSPQAPQIVSQSQIPRSDPKESPEESRRC